ncbi:MAG: hypothetical protein NTV30_05375 [Chloroflexi bacterium]|nr:hypothetical protein [Chloroflexota bacterium]
MNRRKKTIILMAVAVVLALVIGSSTVLLSGASGSNYPINQSMVVSAINQADPGVVGGPVDKLLDKAVEKGLITGDEAIEIKGWLQAKPEVLTKLPPGRCIAAGIAGNNFGLITGEVAAILKVDDSKVADAMKQTRREMQDEAVKKLLDQAVLKTKLTQSQADEIYAWWQKRPAALDKIGVGICMPNGAGRIFIGRVAVKLGVTETQLNDAIKQARQQVRGQTVDTLLSKAVEKGRITQDEATKIKEWWNSKPEGLNKIIPGKFFMKRNNVPKGLQRIIPGLGAGLQNQKSN